MAGHHTIFLGSQIVSSYDFTISISFIRQYIHILNHIIHTQKQTHTQTHKQTHTHTHTNTLINLTHSIPPTSPKL